MLSINQSICLSISIIIKRCSMQNATVALNGQWRVKRPSDQSNRDSTPGSSSDDDIMNGNMDEHVFIMLYCFYFRLYSSVHHKECHLKSRRLQKCPRNPATVVIYLWINTN